MIVELSGEIDPHAGWLVDYGELNKIVNPIIERLDHQSLNDFFDNPTAENMAAWFLHALQQDKTIGAFVSAVTVKETEKTSATVQR